jgi:hypothetical protein
VVALGQPETGEAAVGDVLDVLGELVGVDAQQPLRTGVVGVLLLEGDGASTRPSISRWKAGVKTSGNSLLMVLIRSLEEGARLDNRNLTNFVVTAAIERARQLKKRKG